MKELLKEIKLQINDSSYLNENPHERDWGSEIGILLTRDQAQQLVTAIENKTCPACGIPADSVKQRCPHCGDLGKIQDDQGGFTPCPCHY